MKQQKKSMWSKLRRAFTITELVIVIAVVAILAAVLIPTFANVVETAHESADIQAVRNMNTALQNDETINGAPATASEAMQVLADAGLNAQDYHALQGNTAIYYNKEVNRMVYVNLTDEGGIGPIIYPEEYADTDKADPFWYSFYLLSGRLMTDKNWLLKPGTGDEQPAKTQQEMETAKTSTDAIAENTVYMNGDQIVGAAIADYNGLLSIAEYIETLEDENANSSAGFDVLLGTDIDMSVDGVAQEWKPISSFAGDFYGRGKTISNLKITDPSADSLYFAAQTSNANYAYYGLVSVFTGKYFGNVTIEVNNIDEPGSGVRNAEGFTQNNHTVAGAIGAIYATGGNSGDPHNVTIENVTVKGKITGMNRVAGVVGFIGGYASPNNASKYPHNSTITIQNCVNEATIVSQNRSAATYSTAAGILSVVNQLGENVDINITNCQNKGDISGMWVGGIMADAWRSNDSENDPVTAGSTFANNDPGNMITIDNCQNYGDLLGVCPTLETNKTSAVVVGGIYGAFNGWRLKNFGSSSAPDNRPIERYGLTITNCTNEGKIAYQYNSLFGGQIYLSDIVSLSRAVASQQSVKGFAGVNVLAENVAYAPLMNLVPAGEYANYVPRHMALSGNTSTEAADKFGFYIYQGGEFVSLSQAANHPIGGILVPALGGRTINLLRDRNESGANSQQLKLYIDYVGTTTLVKNTVADVSDVADIEDVTTAN